MEINIQLLNVKDGDAILVLLKKTNASLLMVIDGGESGYYKSKVKPALDKILKSENKKGPDIVVCTHMDSDHIGGLIPLISDYAAHIQEVWVHKTPDLFESNKAIIENLLKTDLTYVDNRSTFLLKDYIKENKLSHLEKELIDKSTLIFESLGQLKRLIDVIPKGKLKEVFHKDKPLAAWPEIQVLGPTKEYFDLLFPSNKKFEDFLLQESLSMIPNKVLDKAVLELATAIDPCDTLKDDTSAKITATNKASIIIAIDTPDKKRLLFTGDAGIESFKKIPDYQNELKNLNWLKIPHHGSENNMSKELSNLMNPVVAQCSGDGYQDDNVLKCLGKQSRNTLVESTKEGRDLEYSI